MTATLLPPKKRTPPWIRETVYGFDPKKLHAEKVTQHLRAELERDLMLKPLLARLSPALPDTFMGLPIADLAPSVELLHPSGTSLLQQMQDAIVRTGHERRREQRQRDDDAFARQMLDFNLGRTIQRVEPPKLGTDVGTRLRALLERTTYKPGWKFRTHPSGFFATAVQIEAQVVSVEDPSKVQPLFHTQGWDLRGDENDHELLGRLKAQIVAFETHEVDEWLKVDGLHVKEPHPEVFVRPTFGNAAPMRNLDRRAGAC